MVDELLAGRGFRGWLRAARVARVLGLFSLYLFLDTYDVRADFNRRAVTRMRDLARERGHGAQLKAWMSAQFYAAFDLFIRGLRYVIFRGADGSARKQARLQKQAVWLRQSLLDLGPTFIKIGQALGTRADLLPLAYVTELATLQDQVPPFSTKLIRRSTANRSPRLRWARFTARASRPARRSRLKCSGRISNQQSVSTSRSSIDS
jgi:hypothetical protein